MADDSRTPLVGPKKAKKSWVDFFVMFRWMIVVPIVLPISFAFECHKRFLDWLSARRNYESKEAAHQKNVEAIQKRLRQRNPGKDGLVCTARKPWLSVSMRNQDYKRARRFEVDLNDFRHILNIDKERMVARVEPFVSMAQLSGHTVPMGLALAVVPELDDLTVGGLINGYGIEGSSHIYGLFQDTVLAYEIVLGDGTLVRATADNEYSDLYYAIPWSQGTLGLLVAAELQLIEVKPYMKVSKFCQNAASRPVMWEIYREDAILLALYRRCTSGHLEIWT
jgi:delta24-sterol reductase